MKALLSRQAGGPDTLVLDEVPAPLPGKGEIGVRVLACAINYPDVLVIEDKYQFRPARPFAPGSEISAVVDAIGADVTGWNIGDRLMAVIPHGGLAERAIVEADQAFTLTDRHDALEGAALLFTYATTLHALADRGHLREGETLLVLGAAGGVGLAAIEIGKAMGATVVAGVSSEAKAEAARAAGADRVMIYGPGPFDKDGARAMAQAFKSAVGPHGADVIYDPVGGDYAEAALRSIAWEGRYLVIGFPAGIPRMPLNLALLKSCDIRGVFWGGFVARAPAQNRYNVERLLAWWDDGAIKPRIDRVYSLADGPTAIQRLSSRDAIGKVVVQISQD